MFKLFIGFVMTALLLGAGIAYADAATSFYEDFRQKLKEEMKTCIPPAVLFAVALFMFVVACRALADVT